MDGRSAVTTHSDYSNVLSITLAYDYASTKASGEDDPVLFTYARLPERLGKIKIKSSSLGPLCNRHNENRPTLFSFHSHLPPERPQIMPKLRTFNGEPRHVDTALITPFCYHVYRRDTSVRRHGRRQTLQLDPLDRRNYLEGMVSYNVDVCGPGLDKVVRQSLPGPF